LNLNFYEQKNADGIPYLHIKSRLSLDDAIIAIEANIDQSIIKNNHIKREWSYTANQWIMNAKVYDVWKIKNKTWRKEGIYIWIAGNARIMINLDAVKLTETDMIALKMNLL